MLKQQIFRNWASVGVGVQTCSLTPICWLLDQPGLVGFVPTNMAPCSKTKNRSQNHSSESNWWHHRGLSSSTVATLHLLKNCTTLLWINTKGWQQKLLVLWWERFIFPTLPLEQSKLSYEVILGFMEDIKIWSFWWYTDPFWSGVVCLHSLH